LAAPFRIPIGPYHPSLKEPEHFIVTVDGEEIVDVDFRIGYIHRGIERGFQEMTWLQGIYLAERICGICSHAHTTCYSENVEKLQELEAPPRGKYIRTIVAELERIHSHVLWLGVAAHEIGFDTLFMYTWRDRELVLDILEMISGNRVNYAMNTLGGVRRDIPNWMVDVIKRKLDALEERIKYYRKVCLTEPTIARRTVSRGILKTSDAIRLCAVGPTARASNVDTDVRRDYPYAAYDEIPFNVVVRDECDVFARVLVRVDEVLEAINIIRYALDHLPEGPIRVKFPTRVKEGESMMRVEAPRGELIHYTLSKGGPKPFRYKVRSPTLANVLSIKPMLMGGVIADIPIVIASIDPCFSCTDRVTIIDVNKRVKKVIPMEKLRILARRGEGERTA